jgi:acyl-CoA synthetase (AMP-forming)/AMP-acid ligase II
MSRTTLGGLDDVLRHAVAVAGDRPAVVAAPAGTILRYRELDAAVDTVAATLRTVVRPGQLVGVCLPNSAEFVIAVFAVARAGAVPAYLNWRLNPAEIAGLATAAGPALLVTTPGRVAELAGVDAPLAGLSGDRLTVARTRGEPGPPPPQGTALVRFTSGTTAAPKGVAVSESGWLSRAVHLLAAVDVLRTGSRVLATGPLTHASGLWLLPTMLRGGCVVVMERFAEDQLPALCAEHDPSLVHLVPTMLRRVLDHEPAAAALAGGQRRLMYGGAPCARPLLDESLDRFGYRMVQQYGSHELGSMTFLGADEHREPELRTSVGRPFPGVAVTIDGDEGPVSATTPWMAGALLVDGRWRCGAGTPLRTGDIGRVDDDGYLYLLDRVEGLLISGGFNVYSAEVEAAIATHPGVLEAAVFGVPDPLWGDRITAAVCPADGAELTPESVIAWCRDTLAGYKCPKDVVFYPRLPRNSNGKVARAELVRRRLAG